MIRVPEARACFLSESTKNIPSPANLLQLLKLVSVIFYGSQRTKHVSFLTLCVNDFVDLLKFWVIAFFVIFFIS